VVAQANSRFLRSAVAGAPAPVGMTSLRESVRDFCAGQMKKPSRWEREGL
jgi:hypothetical protein